MNSITRRQLLVLGSLTASGLAASAALRPTMGLVATETIRARRTKSGLVEAEIIAAPAPVRLAGMMVRALAYNGGVPGPTLRLLEGDHVRLTFTNRLTNRSLTPAGGDEMAMMMRPDVTNLHTHGLPMSPAVDNPFVHVMPGESRVQEFVVQAGNAGTHWYHPHAHGHVGIQQFLGLAGGIIVTGPLDAMPELRAADDHLLVLRDISISNGKIEESMGDADAYGKKGKLKLVNGQVKPRLEAKKSLLRLRLVNASNARVFRLMLEDHPMHLIVTDGGFLEKPVLLKELTLAPGERAEVLVQLERHGDIRLLQLPYNDSQNNGRDNGRDNSDNLTTPETLLTIVAPTDLKRLELPTGFASLEKLEPAKAVITRKLEFAWMPPNGFKIGTQPFDPKRVDIRAKLGTLEVWEISNNARADHSFHLHTHPFQVLARQAANSGRWEDAPYRAWKDTINLESHDKLRIAVPFKAFPGKTVYHCHTSEHEDHGMMGILEVTA